ncbi:hypothetical protein Tco_0857800 [Tanacetum coccineum]|uniref:Uncharacterized protein n=1 Tax=Tanacetum coccineum TaxID=301880 RepID=A0ABQ5BB88_9ASTR
MSNLNFAKTHNMIVYLEKPVECDGFEEIIDFLNASSIKYALTVNPTIYTTCIEQFWATAKAMTVNGERQIQALVEKNVRSDLKFDNAEGTECLPNDAIFEQLTLMGYENLTQRLTFYKAYFSPKWKFFIHTILQCLSAKTTGWNEFSSTIASAIICLATNQKFNFSKYIFDSMMKNLEGGVKFFMYPRFVQIFINQQLGDMSKHKGIYVTPSHTKKVFANMKREGKGFSGRVTPLFQTMMVQAPEELGEGSEIPPAPQHTPIITQPSPSQPQKKQKSRRKQIKGAEIPSSSGAPIADEAANVASISTHSNDPLLSEAKTAQAKEIANLKKRVKKLEKSRKSRTPGLKRLRKVGSAQRVESPEDEGLGDQEDASKQGRKIADINQDAKITLVDETQGRNDEELLFDMNNDLQGEEVIGEEVAAEKEVSVADPVTTVGEVVTTVSAKIPDELTLAQTLIEIKAAKSKDVTTSTTTTTTAVIRLKAKGVVIQEPSETTTTPSIPSKDKGKGIMVEDPLKMKKKDQIMFDEEVARNLEAQLQAELEEEERSARQREEEANIALIES